MFKQETLIGTGLGLLVGFLLGYVLGNQPATSTPQPALAAAPAPSQGGVFEGISPTPAGIPGLPPTQATAPVSAVDPAMVFAAEQATVQNPKDVQAWVHLGNLYFDGHEHQKAIDAYDKALALNPNNPDVITDQGVMYKELYAPEKAVAKFEKAQKVDPTHIQSLFNLGVVYANELKAPAKAEKAWARVIEIAPTSPQAAQARTLIDHLKGK